MGPGTLDNDIKKVKMTFQKHKLTDYSEIEKLQPWKVLQPFFGRLDRILLHGKY